jgi:hypothetical protein
MVSVSYPDVRGRLESAFGNPPIGSGGRTQICYDAENAAGPIDELAGPPETPTTFFYLSVRRPI